MGGKVCRCTRPGMKKEREKNVRVWNKSTAERTFWWEDESMHRGKGRFVLPFSDYLAIRREKVKSNSLKLPFSHADLKFLRSLNAYHALDRKILRIHQCLCDNCLVRDIQNFYFLSNFIFCLTQIHSKLRNKRNTLLETSSNTRTIAWAIHSRVSPFIVIIIYSRVPLERTPLAKPPCFLYTVFWFFSFFFFEKVARVRKKIPRYWNSSEILLRNSSDLIL